MLSETKCPYAHQLGVVNGPSAHWVVHIKDSCALTSQAVCASEHRHEFIHLPAQLKGWPAILSCLFPTPLPIPAWYSLLYILSLYISVTFWIFNDYFSHWNQIDVICIQLSSLSTARVVLPIKLRATLKIKSGLLKLMQSFILWNKQTFSENKAPIHNPLSPCD